MIDIEFAEPLEPGVYVTEKKNVFYKEELEKCIMDCTKDLPWVEKAEIVDSEEVIKDKSMQNDDYEMQFVEQAQSHVKIGIAMLAENNVITQRPADYYAEMLKLDDHMNKLKESLIKNAKREEMRILIRKQREGKKFGKNVQREVTLQKQKEKTEFLKDIKKYRKDPKSVDLQSILEPNAGKNKRVNKKREFKNKKYSMGGKRSGMKRNTKESAREMGDFNPQKHQNRPGFKKETPNKKKFNKKK